MTLSGLEFAHLVFIALTPTVFAVLSIKRPDDSNDMVVEEFQSQCGMHCRFVKRFVTVQTE